jgi:hypothetical protein
LGRFIQFTNRYLTPFRDVVLKAINILPQHFPDLLIEKYLYSYTNSTRDIFPKFYLNGERLPQPIVFYKNKKVYLDLIIKDKWVILTKEEEIMKNNVFGADLFYITDKIIDSQYTIYGENLLEWFKRKKIDFVIVRPDKIIYSGGKKEDFNTQLKKFNPFLAAIYSFKKTINNFHLTNSAIL